MSGGTREGAGRKPVQIDLSQLEKLCALLCRDEEIASWLGVSVRTLQNRRKQPAFAEAMRRGKAMGWINIRRAQMRLLDAGNAAMGVWLGKSELGQRDTSSIRMVLPKIRTAQDVCNAAEKVTQAVVRGNITLADGEKVMRMLESQSRIIEKVDIERRVQKLEENMGAAPVSGPTIIGLPGSGAVVTMRLNSEHAPDVVIERVELESRLEKLETTQRVAGLPRAA